MNTTNDTSNDNATDPMTITTERLVLRRPAAADAPAMYEGWAGDAESTRYMGWPRHTSVADTLAVIATFDEEWKQTGVGPLHIEQRDSGLLLGTTGLTRLSETCASTGYILRPDARGQGYCTEALRAVIDWARMTGFRELVAGIHPDNTASLHVLERAGFTQGEGSVQACCTFANLPQDQQRPPIEFVLRL